MPMNLLERLSCLQLPLHIVLTAEIKKCEVLRNAAWIEADLPPLLHGRGHSMYSGEAIVMRVTEAGLAALRRSRSRVALPIVVTVPGPGPSPASPEPALDLAVRAMDETKQPVRSPTGQVSAFRS